jgi:hypothetical protein
MRRRLISSALVPALVLACVGLSSASASGAMPVTGEEGPPLAFSLRGTHGYLISGFAYAEPVTGAQEVGITVSRGKEYTSYTAPARVTADSVRADLGALGRIDLVLHLSGQKKTVDIRCSHESETYEAGTFEGIVEFDGEHGFTRARATKLAGRPAFALTARHFCQEHGTGESRNQNEPGARLAGLSFAHGRALKFQLNKNRAGGRVIYSATLKERRGGIRIFCELSGVAPAGAFRYRADLRTATLSPPAPFTGAATLTRTPNSVSPHLAGSLTIAFPGKSVRLAGQGTHVSLVHAYLNRSKRANTAGI